MHPAWVLTGPTASGKTDVALLIAEELRCEIVAMDSATLYRGMNIGTAKPDAAQQARVRHHLLDLADPSTTLSVAEWLRAALAAEADAAQRGKRVLFSGGTPLYLKALLEGLFEGPPRDEGLRARLAAAGDLHGQLARVDPAAARKLHPNDAKRLVRALEVHALTGRKISDLQEQWGGETRPSRIVILDPPREVLRDRIEARARAMFAAGLVDEAAALPLSTETRKFIGYAEALEAKAGRLTKEQAVAQVVARTWTLVRRQTTWFRKLKGALRITGEAEAAQVADYFRSP
jgi:tRNA dimethylallyltransferase